MAFATFSGPVRCGTVKDAPGVNTGCIVLSQTAALGLTTSTPFILPAGAQILNFYIDVTTTFTTSATLAVGDGTTVNKYVTAITTPAAGRQTNTPTAAQITAMSNIGTTDVTVTVTMAGTTATAGAGFITVVYVQHLSDGAQVPPSA